MGHLAPAGPVYQAGTLSGNPVATAAGLATLQLATEDAYAGLDATALRLRAEVAAALTAASVPHVFGVAGSMFSVFFTDPAVTPQVTDYDAARTQDGAAYAAFFHAMLARGVYLPPSGYESWFVSTVHDDAALDRVVDALPAAAAAAAGVTAAAAAAGVTAAAAAAGVTAAAAAAGVTAAAAAAGVTAAAAAAGVTAAAAVAGVTAAAAVAGVTAAAAAAGGGAAG